MRRRVVILGDEVKTFLFADKDAIGEIVYVGHVPFTVVGVMIKKKQDSSYAQRDKDRIFIPASTFNTVFGITRLSNIIFQLNDPYRSEEIMADVRSVLSSRYKFDPADKDAVPMWDTTISDKFAANLFMAFNSFLGLIGSFTLAVAGLGVANIMFIVVQERTNEIGIKRAMGARRKDIMRAIFMETFYRTPRIGHRFRHRSRYHRSHAICADRRICRYAGTFTRGCRRNRRRSDDRQHMRRSHAGPPGS